MIKKTQRTGYGEKKTKKINKKIKKGEPKNET
jgi:hypothetical protein